MGEGAKAGIAERGRAGRGWSAEWNLKTLRVLETLRVLAGVSMMSFSMLYGSSAALALSPGPCYNIYAIIYNSESRV
jgi:hypothetical protein